MNVGRCTQALLIDLQQDVLASCFALDLPGPAPLTGPKMFVDRILLGWIFAEPVELISKPCHQYLVPAAPEAGSH